MAVRSRMMVPSTASRVLIQIDDDIPGALSGVLYSPYLQASAVFRDVMDLANILDELFDSISFPQASMSYRSFNTGRKGGTKGTTPNSRLAQGDRAQVLAEDEKNVFIVHVQFRQNAEWQGTVQFGPKAEPLHFRSMLELFRHIDDVLQAGH